jgi:hypothetical protein
LQHRKAPIHPITNQHSELAKAEQSVKSGTALRA